MSQLKKYADKKGRSLPHLYRDVDSLEFWAVIRVGRKIRKRNLKTQDYIRAVALLPATLAELGSLEYEEKRRPTNKLLSDFWADLIKEKIANEASPATLKRMDTVWTGVLDDYLGNWRADQVTAGMVPSFVEWYRLEHPGRQLFNVYKYMGNLFGYMYRVGAIDRSQVPVLKLPKSEKKHHDKKKGRIATDTEVKTILGLGSDRLQLVNGVLEALGMRVMEFVSIEKSRILIENKRFFLELTEDDTKTGLARILPVPRHLEKMLELQMEASRGSRFLFPTKNLQRHLPYQLISKEWVAVRKLANISGRLKLHDWRHRRATLMAKANVNPIIACTLLGMSLRIYQKVYAQLTGRDLVATVDQMHEGRL